jgi:DNA replication and repair protein RecF
LFRLQRVTLTDFRNYKSLTFTPDARLNVVTGANGSGKTNLLEAISLLIPGRGLRASRPEGIPRVGADTWAVAARIERDGVVHDVGTGTLVRATSGPAAIRPRSFRLDGEPVRTQADISSLMSIVWLTPQMERLFGEAASGRRRFLDRLVSDVDSSHPRAMAAHEAAVGNRNRLLIERHEENAWLSATEDAIARHATAATAARLGYCRRINVLGGTKSGFPASRLILQCPIAERLETDPARLVEDWLRETLAQRRPDDARQAVTTVGAHRTDLMIEERETGLPAHLASTGQQKSLLVGLILAHASLIEADRGQPPLLLLDEPLVHLDGIRREGLFRHLSSIASQILLTGTDAASFDDLTDEAAFWQVAGNMVVTRSSSAASLAAGGRKHYDPSA